MINLLGWTCDVWWLKHVFSILWLQCRFSCYICFEWRLKFRSLVRINVDDWFLSPLIPLIVGYIHWGIVSLRGLVVKTWNGSNRYLGECSEIGGFWISLIYFFVHSILKKEDITLVIALPQRLLDCVFVCVHIDICLLQRVEVSISSIKLPLVAIFSFTPGLLRLLKLFHLAISLIEVWCLTLVICNSPSRIRIHNIRIRSFTTEIFGALISLWFKRFRSFPEVARSSVQIGVSLNVSWNRILRRIPQL